MRKSAGTRTATELLRHPTEILRGLKGLTFGAPEGDRHALESGEELEITAGLVQGSRVRRGRLLVSTRPARSVVWQPRRAVGYGRRVVLAIPEQAVPPASPERGVQPDVEGPQLWTVPSRVVVLLADGVERRFAVPASDVDLLGS